ncbi:MAG: prolipoprotein diacylglyceryl transferase family protein [Patescibacteria group bacterium]
MYPILLSIAGFHLTSFSVFIILSWCVFSFVFWKSLLEEGVSEDRIFDLMFYATLVSIVVARMGFVLTHWDQFAGAILRTVALWVAPGLSLYAGVGSALGAMAMLSKRYKVRIGAVLDAFGLALPGALIVGSVGSLLDGAEIGKVARLFWAIRYVGLPEFRHPYQLYAILSLVIIFIIVGFLWERRQTMKLAMGAVGIGFFLLWAPSIFVLEYFKDNHIYWYNLSINQWMALVLFSLAFGVWYVYSGGKFIVGRIVRSIYGRIPKRHS